MKPATIEESIRTWQQLHANDYFRQHRFYKQNPISDVGVYELQSMVHFRSTDHVADIGGGYGRLAFHLASCVEMWNVFEVSDAPFPFGRMLMEKHKRITESLHTNFVVYDGRYIHYPSHSIDVVVCFAVMQHLPDESQLNLLREMRRVCKRDLVVQYMEQDFVYDHPVILPGSCETTRGIPFAEFTKRHVGAEVSISHFQNRRWLWAHETIR